MPAVLRSREIHPLNFNPSLFLLHEKRQIVRTNALLSGAAGLTHRAATHAPQTARAAGRLIENATLLALSCGRDEHGAACPPVLLGAGAAGLMRGGCQLDGSGDVLHTRTRPLAGRCAENSRSTAIPLCNAGRRFCPNGFAPAADRRPLAQPGSHTPGCLAVARRPRSTHASSRPRRRSVDDGLQAVDRRKAPHRHQTHRRRPARQARREGDAGQLGKTGHASPRK